MRRALPYLLALLLGVGAALLAACGQTTRGGIPAGNASDLKRQLEDVRQRVADGRCDELSRELRQVNNRVGNLPRSVDARLVQALRNGADRLQRTAVEDCNANSVPTQTETAPPVTQTETQTDTQTQPPETTPPTETTTAPPDTTTTPPTTTDAPPPPDTAPVPPPPIDPGGVPPEVP